MASHYPHVENEWGQVIYTSVSVYICPRGSLVIVFSFRDDDMTWRHCEILQSTKDYKVTTNVINHKGVLGLR